MRRKLTMTALALAATLLMSAAYAGSALAGGERCSFAVVGSFEVDSPWSWGIGFDGTNLWVSSGQPFSHADTTMFWIYTPEGSLVESFVQEGGTEWGARDLTFDGTYMFGSEDGQIRGFNASGQYVGWFGGPLMPNRGLAYDGTYFYCCNYDNAVYKVLWSGTWNGPPDSITPIISAADGFRYGLAYDEVRDCLWMTYADTTTARIERYGTDGTPEGTYSTLPEYDTPAGAAMAYTSRGYVLAVLHIDSGHASGTDRVVLYDVSDTPVETTSWGRIKGLFR